MSTPSTVASTRRTLYDAADLDAVAEFAHGIRIPKVESVDDVRWVTDRAPGIPLICAIESAKGVANALAIAAEPGVDHLDLGGIDLQKDLGTGSSDAPLHYVRSHLVAACRTAGLAPPIDSVYPHIDDTDGLRRQTRASRELGFFGKSAIYPSQLPHIHAAFSSRADELEWERTVLDVFDNAHGAALRLPGGEFVDLPVAERARKILALADALPSRLTSDDPRRPASASPGQGKHCIQQRRRPAMARPWPTVPGLPDADHTRGSRFESGRPRHTPPRPSQPDAEVQATESEDPDSMLPPHRTALRWVAYLTMV
ncbi:putative citrate lyase beta chain [Rhodococcus wratislaviensis IFP 2016]|uniref:Putative citrate lyase beta chain n=1 Tax=Rhodococcus opacus M213 TaxID=1129896 RepID=K8XJ33_RHOOP|nr:putative citrate lyase beta chain [Rhodococcus opacus M213]ELB94986.1 putative citrate lyase beta chain [Rhodococcus wratislaviensis IFP 2016]